MPIRVRIFIDFWNFQLNWNDRMGVGKNCDWRALPIALLEQTNDILKSAGGVLEMGVLEETLLYASVNPERDAKLRSWLENTIDRFPSFRVKVSERRLQRKTVHCRHCGVEIDACADCGQAYTVMVEKGVDTAIVTDLLSLAWQDAFDVAVIVSSDADFVPAAQNLQERGLKVINASWSGHGHHLAKACWGSFNLDDVAPRILR